MLVVISYISDKITNTDITETKPINRYPISQLQYRCILIYVLCAFTVWTKPYQPERFLHARYIHALLSMCHTHLSESLSITYLRPCKLTVTNFKMCDCSLTQINRFPTVFLLIQLFYCVSIGANKIKSLNKHH